MAVYTKLTKEDVEEILSNYSIGSLRVLSLVVWMSLDKIPAVFPTPKEPAAVLFIMLLTILKLPIGLPI